MSCFRMGGALETGKRKENAFMMTMNVSASPTLLTTSTGSYYFLPKIYLLPRQHRCSIPDAGIDDARPLNRIREVFSIYALQETRENS